MSKPLLLLALGALMVAACFLVPGPVGIALVFTGCVVCWCGTLAAFKHRGWF